MHLREGRIPESLPSAYFSPPVVCVELHLSLQLSLKVVLCLLQLAQTLLLLGL